MAPAVNTITNKVGKPKHPLFTASDIFHDYRTGCKGSTVAEGYRVGAG